MLSNYWIWMNCNRYFIRIVVFWNFDNYTSWQGDCWLSQAGFQVELDPDRSGKAGFDIFEISIHVLTWALIPSLPCTFFDAPVSTTPSRVMERRKTQASQLSPRNQSKYRRKQQLDDQLIRFKMFWISIMRLIHAQQKDITRKLSVTLKTNHSKNVIK